MHAVDFSWQIQELPSEELHFLSVRPTGSPLNSFWLNKWKIEQNLKIH